MKSKKTTTSHLELEPSSKESLPWKASLSSSSVLEPKRLGSGHYRPILCQKHSSSTGLNHYTVRRGSLAIIILQRDINFSDLFFFLLLVGSWMVVFDDNLSKVIWCRYRYGFLGIFWTFSNMPIKSNVYRGGHGVSLLTKLNNIVYISALWFNAKSLDVFLIMHAATPTAKSFLKNTDEVQRVWWTRPRLLLWDPSMKQAHEKLMVR